MTNTDSKAKYIAAWEAHIRELTSLGMPLTAASTTARSYYAELEAVQTKLYELVQIAAMQDFDN